MLEKRGFGAGQPGYQLNLWAFLLLCSFAPEGMLGAINAPKLPRESGEELTIGVCIDRPNSSGESGQVLGELFGYGK